MFVQGIPYDLLTCVVGCGVDSPCLGLGSPIKECRAFLIVSRACVWLAGHAYYSPRALSRYLQNARPTNQISKWLNMCDQSIENNEVGFPRAA